MSKADWQPLYMRFSSFKQAATPSLEPLTRFDSMLPSAACHHSPLQSDEDPLALVQTSPRRDVVLQRVHLDRQVQLIRQRRACDATKDARDPAALRMEAFTSLRQAISSGTVDRLLGEFTHEGDESQLTVVRSEPEAQRGNSFRFLSSVGTWLQALPMEQPPVVTRRLDSMLPSAGCFDSSAQPDAEPFDQYVPSIVLPQTHSLMPSVGTWIAMKPRLGVSPAPDPPKRLMDLPSHELKMMHRSELIDAMKEELKRKDEEIEVLRRKVGNSAGHHNHKHNH